MTAVSLISYTIVIIIPLFAFYLVFALDMFGTGKESTVGICLAWGAFGAFGLAYLLNRYFFLDTLNLRTTIIIGFTAPILEEFLKALILVYFIQQPRFRYIVDGAVYGFAAGIGFSVFENISYLGSGEQSGALMLAISRVLSTSLMHASASAMVGIALGNIRRARNAQRYGSPLVGIFLACIIHIAFNNLVLEVQGATLLLIAIGFGIVSAGTIGFLINQGLSEEKKRFNETLGIQMGVSSAERKAVQQLGGEGIEKILDELGAFFGEDKTNLIRKLLVTQANIGILKNNLANPVSDRLRDAWEKEIATLRGEVDIIRNTIGVYVMSFLRNIFPEDDVEVQSIVSEELAKYDPEHVHTFDMFITASAAAQTLNPQQIEEIALRLQKIALFKSAELVDLENLCRAIKVRQFKAGATLFQKGDEGDAMYLIDDGAIEIYTSDVSGEDKVLRTCYSGEIFGEMSLLDGQPRSASARASRDLQVMVLRREHFMMFIRSRPKMILLVLKFLASKVRDTTTAVENSIQKVRAIAEGNYSEAQKTALIAEGKESQTNDNKHTLGSLSIAVETDEMALAPHVLSGAFAMLATALEERETALEDAVSLHNIAASKRKERKGILFDASLAED